MQTKERNREIKKKKKKEKEIERTFTKGLQLHLVSLFLLTTKIFCQCNLSLNIVVQKCFKLRWFLLEDEKFNKSFIKKYEKISYKIYQN